MKRLYKVNLVAQFKGLIEAENEEIAESKAFDLMEHENEIREIESYKCFNCGHLYDRKDDEFWWHHGDQDDRVCEHCAKILRHTDTAMAGMSVF